MPLPMPLITPELDVSLLLVSSTSLSSLLTSGHNDILHFGEYMSRSIGSYRKTKQKQGAPLVCLPSGKKQKNQEVEVNFFWEL